VNHLLTDAQCDWQPGDPLYQPDALSAELPMLKLKDDTAYNIHADGARWPTPRPRHDLDRLW
jgi:hypothetical protein